MMRDQTIGNAKGLAIIAIVLGTLCAVWGIPGFSMTPRTTTP